MVDDRLQPKWHNWCNLSSLRTRNFTYFTTPKTAVLLHLRKSVNTAGKQIAYHAKGSALRW